MSGDDGRRSGSRSAPVSWLDPVAGSPIEVAGGALLGIAVALVGMVWGAATISTLLVEQHRPAVGVADAGRAAVRFGTNGFRWDGTWPAEIETTLADPLWFWLVFAFEALLAALAFWPIWRLLGPRPADPMAVVIEPTPAKHPRAAKRAAAREARAARRAARAAGGEPEPPTPATTGGVEKLMADHANGRLVLGRHDGRLVTTERHNSVLVLGPTQSGKTVGLTIPALLEWRGPAMVISSKSDLISRCWSERSDGEGMTWLFDPTGAMAGMDDVGPASTWSPLNALDSIPQPRNVPELDRRVRQWAVARRTAEWLVTATRTSPRTDLPEPWYVAAEQRLAPMLLAAATDEVPIGSVADWLDRNDDEAVTAALERSGVGTAADAWSGWRSHDEAARAGSRQVIATALHPFGDPAIRASTTKATIDIGRLLDGRPNTLFVLAPQSHEDRLRPLITTLLAETLDGVVSRAMTTKSGRLRQPLLVVLDDSTGSIPLRLLDQLAAGGAGLGVQLVTVGQDLGHLQHRLGANEAIQLANDHRAKILLPGISDGATLDYVNALIRGNQLVGEYGDDRVVGGSATWMRTLADGEALCVYGNLHPIHMQLRPWFADPALRDRLVPPPERRRRRFFARGRTGGEPVGGGFPNPLDSEANDREAARYWDAVKTDGLLPDPKPYDDGSG